MALRRGTVLVHTNVLSGEVTGEFEQAERDGKARNVLTLRHLYCRTEHDWAECQQKGLGRLAWRLGSG